MLPIDEVKLSFSPASLNILNAILAFILFGIALDLTTDDFKRIFKHPKAVLLGMLSQLILLPVLTFVIIALAKPLPSIALGMLLVACCPGGNVSNFMTHYAKGNAALSVTLTSISTLAAIIITPLAFGLYGNVFEYTRPLMNTIEVPVYQVIFAISILVGIPLFFGLLISNKWPKIANKLKKPMRIFSLLFFMAFLAAMIFSNAAHFKYLPVILGLVLIHNALALFTGYGVGTIGQLKSEDRKALTIETGIQNSGLGLFLIFNFFNGIGGMAMVAALWGIWHLVSGLGLAIFWRKTNKK